MDTVSTERAEVVAHAPHGEVGGLLARYRGQLVAETLPDPHPFRASGDTDYIPFSSINEAYSIVRLVLLLRRYLAFATSHTTNLNQGRNASALQFP